MKMLGSKFPLEIMCSLQRHFVEPFFLINTKGRVDCERAIGVPNTNRDFAPRFFLYRSFPVVVHHGYVRTPLLPRPNRGPSQMALHYDPIVGPPPPGPSPTARPRLTALVAGCLCLAALCLLAIAPPATRFHAAPVVHRGLRSALTASPETNEGALWGMSPHPASPLRFPPDSDENQGIAGWYPFFLW